MRIGSLARSQGKLVALLVAVASTAMLPLTSFGQLRELPSDARNSSGGQGPRQALYHAPAEGETTDANGNQMVVPAGYYQQCGDACGGYGNGSYGNGSCGNGSCGNGSCGNGGYGCGGHGGGNCGPGCQGGYPGCCPMGAGGTDPAVGYDLMNDAGIEGNFVDQRGPHYFDVRMEAVFLKRDQSFPFVDFTSLNVSNQAGTNIVLSGSQLDLEDEYQPGFRIVGRYDICPLSVLEFGYMGVFDWNDSASVSDPTNNLYSLFSRPATEAGPFGLSPSSPVPVTTPDGPNPFSERASFQGIQISSDLQSAEISYRRYCLGWSPRVSGTLLAGFRYTRVDENFAFFTQGSDPYVEPPFTPQQTTLASLRYEEECENNLAGFQTGGEIWVSIFQGLRIGSEAKFGIYNNYSRLTNTISTNPQNVTLPSTVEDFKNNNVAFLTDGSVDLVADLLPSLSVRVGYEVLFLNELVLAGDNFNQQSPYNNQVYPRSPFVDTHGELFYHGGHVGLEYCW